MSKQIMTLEELFKKLSADTGETTEQITQEFGKIVEEVKADERYVNLTPTDIEQIARNKLLTRKRREMSSPAQTWEGVVLAKMDLIDGVRTIRAISVAAFKKDPTAAQAEKGFLYEGRLVRTDDNGVPLYPKTEVNDKWGRSGKPIPEHSWMRTVVGVAAPVDKKTHKAGEVKRFSMTLNDKNAVDCKGIPMNTPVRFKGIDKTTDDARKAGEYIVGHSALTNFEVAPDLKLPPIETILQSILADKMEVLGQVEEWHLKNKDSFGRWLVTEGTVSWLNPEANQYGSIFMSLDDESLLLAPTEDGKTATVGCFIPTDRGIVIDFAQDSRVYVIGRTSQGKKKDEAGNKTDEPGAVGINVYGIYCPEMFKVVQSSPVPANALEPKQESTEPKGEW